MTEKKPGTRPTVGYAKDGRSRTFELGPGEKLPEGWSDFPPPGHHPHDKDGTNPPPEASEEPEPASKKGKKESA